MTKHSTVGVDTKKNKGHIASPKKIVLIFRICINVIYMGGNQISSWDWKGSDRQDQNCGVGLEIFRIGSQIKQYLKARF